MSAKKEIKGKWRAKFERVKEPMIVDIDPRMEKKWGKGTMLISTPKDIDAVVRKVPKGKLLTMTQLREKLAKDAGTNITCPLTSGIFMRIVAEAAEEDRQAGKTQITPYWRVIKPDGSLNEKFPGAPENQAKHLKEEGHTIMASKTKKPPKLKDFDKDLTKM